MTNIIKQLAAAGGITVGVLGAAPAFAAGTTAGSTITNTATLSYQVGGVAQTAINASNNITVDRKITLTVAEVGSATTSVAPGSSAQVTAFTVTNTSNDTLDLGLTAAQLAGGTAAHGGTDNFDLTGLNLFIDTNSNGAYDAGTDQAVTYLDEIAADASRTVFVVGNVPISQTNGDVAGVTLVAQARSGGGGGSQGAVIAETAGANTAAMDTVFADAAGPAAGDAARDGMASDDDDYTVSAPILSVTKQSRVVSDPVNGATNPKLIPGAVVEYCIVVANAAGGSAADSVTISDPLPAQTTFVAASSFLNGTYTGSTPTGACNLDGTAGGSVAAGTLNGTLGTIAAGTTRTLYFQVTIN
jgi:uncharacterized repeat protein (TIGR01451 family)